MVPIDVNALATVNDDNIDQERIMSEPLRWGVLGPGRIAHTFASDLAFTDEGIITAVGSRSASSADKFGDEFSIPNRHSSYEAKSRGSF